MRKFNGHAIKMPRNGNRYIVERKTLNRLTKCAQFFSLHFAVYIERIDWILFAIFPLKHSLKHIDESLSIEHMETEKKEQTHTHQPIRMMYNWPTFLATSSDIIALTTI